MFGMLFLIPLYWIRVAHASTGAAGLGLLIIPLAIMISAPISGRLKDKKSCRSIITIGMLLTAVGSAGLVFLSGSVRDPAMLDCLVALGTGFGFVQSSSMAAVISRCPETYSVWDWVFSICFQYVSNRWGNDRTGNVRNSVRECKFCVQQPDHDDHWSGWNDFVLEVCSDRQEY